MNRISTRSDRLPSRTGLPWVWGDTGSTAPPPDFPGREVRLVRAVRVNAPRDVVYGWLGQLRAAPYSYDLLDNFGRRSPTTMTQTEEIEIGQTFARVFTLTSFDPGRSLTLKLTDPGGLRLFGPLTLVYRAVAEGDATVLRCDLLLPRPRPGLETLRQLVLAWGDLVMMRRQLLNLGRLSELTASAP